MAAIAEELVFREPSPTVDDDSPEVSVVEGPAGRETLALIESASRPPRSRQSTLGYGDRISNAPGAKTPSRPPISEKKPSRAPSKTPSHAPGVKPASHAPGVKAPSHAPGTKASSHSPAQTASRAPIAPVAPTPLGSMPTIFEMFTFVVQGAEVASLASDAQRRRFVESYLIARLPRQDMAQVDRIDVTPWTVKDTVVVRVWCRI